MFQLLTFCVAAISSVVSMAISALTSLNCATVSSTVSMAPMNTAVTVSLHQINYSHSQSASRHFSLNTFEIPFTKAIILHLIALHVIDGIDMENFVRSILLFSTQSQFPQSSISCFRLSWTNQVDSMNSAQSKLLSLLVMMQYITHWMVLRMISVKRDLVYLDLVFSRLSSTGTLFAKTAQHS